PAANITLVARTIQEPINDLARKHPNVTLHERNFKLWDLWDKDLVVLATDNRQLHETIRNFARSRRLLINVADTPDLCDFYLGSVVTKGNLKIVISTNERSTTISKRFRQYLAEALPQDTNDQLENMQKTRQR